MQHLTSTKDVDVFIMTPQALEALDIEDYFSHRGGVRVTTVDKVAAAMHLIAQTTAAPKQVFFGFNIVHADATECLEALIARGWPLVIVNGHTANALTENMPVLIRPFSSDDLDRVVARTWA